MTEHDKVIESRLRALEDRQLMHPEDRDHIESLKRYWNLYREERRREKPENK